MQSSNVYICKNYTTSLLSQFILKSMKMLEATFTLHTAIITNNKEVYSDRLKSAARSDQLFPLYALSHDT